jgi:hypothetical protein
MERERVISIVELDAPDSFLLKVGGAPDWRTGYTTHWLGSRVRLAATETGVLVRAAPIIQSHLDYILSNPQTWQVILEGRLQYE